MPKTSLEPAHLTANEVANSLRVQGIDFRGPFRSQGGRIVFVVENCIFLESELIELLSQNSLDREGIRRLATRVQSLNSTQ
jgi:hypothetical protein